MCWNQPENRTFIYASYPIYSDTEDATVPGPTCIKVLEYVDNYVKIDVSGVSGMQLCNSGNHSDWPGCVDDPDPNATTKWKKIPKNPQKYAYIYRNCLDKFPGTCMSSSTSNVSCQKG